MAEVYGQKSRDSTLASQELCPYNNLENETPEAIGVATGASNIQANRPNASVRPAFYQRFAPP